MEQVKCVKVQWSKDYTPLRQFYAWVGFITLILAVLAIGYLVYVGNVYINTY